ncbi:lipase member H [Parasteatoda tepidariorum]|uniref:lipase member H n=1 Tax=Parasteatoda tepidariorum TaxID=114398 RepID=UPI0039BC729C
MVLKIAVERRDMYFLVILWTALASGFCQVSDDKFSFCGGFSRLISSVFGGVDPNLKYMLFTRSNAQDACDLQPTEEAFRTCNFNPNRKTAIIVHGWIPKLQTNSPVFTIKDKLLQVDDYNVVVFNWTVYSNTYNYTSNVDINYNFAIVNSFYAALKLSSWMHFLQIHGANTNYFHLINHSLGCVLTHLAVQPLCNIRHITYLDAAGPRFKSILRFLRPSNTDAYFVEAIHTNGAISEKEGEGLIPPIADIDYYPNGGQLQPKCVKGARFRTETGEIDTVTSQSKKNSCNHNLSFFYYIASFNKTCQFLGRICDSYEDFNAGKCSSAPVCRMGFYSKKLPNLPAHSKCYLKTSAEFPYCLD